MPSAARVSGASARGAVAPLVIWLATACGGSTEPEASALAVTTTALPEGVRGAPYDQTVSATGGDGSYSWSLSLGTLPAGLTLGASTGAITGTPTSEGSSSFTLRVASGDGQSATRELDLVVGSPPTLPPSESCTAEAGYAIATFGDAILEDRVRQELGVGPAAELRCDLLAGLTTLDAEDEGIASLLGIQNLTGLKVLQLAINDITDLAPLSRLTSLTELVLDDNAVSDIGPLATLASLTRLSADGNAITDINPVGSLTRLVDLDLSDNLSIDDISALSSLVGLVGLDLDRNAIADLTPLAGLTSLEVVDLDRNSVTDLGPLVGLVNLRELYLVGNDGVGSIQSLIDNPGVGAGDIIELGAAGVPCGASHVLFRRGVSIGLVGCQYVPADGSCAVRPDWVIATLADDALDAAVRAALGIGVQDETTCGLLRAMTALDAGGAGISSLLGAQNLSGLATLLLDANSITDVGSLVDLTDLDTVDLSSNSGLSDVQALVDNGGIGAGDTVDLTGTSADCGQVAVLIARGVVVTSACP